MKQILSCLILLLGTMQVLAQTDQAKPVQTMQHFGEYTVHFSVFNSTFISPEIAEAYQLTRADDRALVNISLTRTIDDKTSAGLPARVNGTATNLIQQQRALEFKTINEGEATYYIASLRHTNEEVINFVIDVQVNSAARPFTVQFTRHLHTDN